MHSKAANVRLLDGENEFTADVLQDFTDTQGRYQEKRLQSPFALMFMLYLIYFDNETNFPC